VRVAEQAAAGLETSTDELAAARWLDAEDATVRQALAWAMDHETGILRARAWRPHQTKARGSRSCWGRGSHYKR
jgi:hypothetical protein